MVSIVGYHTCSTKGGPREVIQGAPFLSGGGKRQWLSQGYYFWTDSDYFAHQWGERGYEGDYAIVRCILNIEEVNFLDLVGSVDDQLYFLDQINQFKNFLVSCEVKEEEITVGDIIRLIRAVADVDFPYVAIKAQDILLHGKVASRNMFPFRAGRPEQMPAITRQQICIFESGYGCIVEKQLVHPDNFVS